MNSHLKIITTLALTAVPIAAGFMARQHYLVAPAPIKISGLHSLTGTMAVSEKPRVDSEISHMWKVIRVGKVRPDGQIEQVFASGAPVWPNPWPGYRSRDTWQILLGGEPS